MAFNFPPPRARGGAKVAKGMPFAPKPPMSPMPLMRPPAGSVKAADGQSFGRSAKIKRKAK